jgi:dCMP deaminase
MDNTPSGQKVKRYNDLYMDLAERISQMSFARRLKVGSVLVKGDNVLSYGWNGMPSGWDNDCETVEWTYDERDTHSSTDWRFCETSKKYFRLKTRPEVLHSEANCIAKISKSTNSAEGSTLYVTHSPCIDCAKLIHQSGINSVYYRNVYRTNDGVKFLERCGVNVENI